MSKEYEANDEKFKVLIHDANDKISELQRRHITPEVESSLVYYQGFRDGLRRGRRVIDGKG